MRQYLSASCEPLGLLVEEPEVGGPEKAVEEAKEDRDVALAELGTGAAAINLRVPHCQSVKRNRILFTASFWQSMTATDRLEQTFFKPIGRQF